MQTVSSTAGTTCPLASAALFTDPLAHKPAATFEFPAGVTVADWLVESEFNKLLTVSPVLVLLNGEALLEADFNTLIDENDVITLVAQPFAGPLLIIGWVITALVSAYSLYLALTLDVGLTGDDDRSSNYSVSYRGNRKRPGEPIPVVYGQTRVYPDLSAQSFTEFDAAGDQILFQLFEITQGEADVPLNTMRYEETLLSDFSGVTVEVMQPGVASKLFPSAVNNVGAVSDIETTTTISGPYTVCEVGDTVTAIWLDFSAPEGMFIRNSLGKYYPMAVALDVYYREVGTSTWRQTTQDGLDVDMLYSFDAYSRTFKIEGLTPARYEVQLKRRFATDGDTNTADKVIWKALRGFIPTDYTQTTTRVAIQVRASNQLGNLALSQFSCVPYRKLPIWNGSTWSAPQLTKSPVWAFCDANRNATYGGSRPDAYLDLAGLKALADTYDASTAFNGVFDTHTPLWGALGEIGRCLLARPVELPGSIYTLVVDEQQPPSAMFTMRQIVAGSFKLDYVGVTDETTDSVDVMFKDETQEFRDTNLLCVPSGSSGDSPAEVKLRGPTSVLAAAAIGIRMANENRFRRITANWTTGLEGYIPSYGDTVRVQHYMLGVELGITALSGDITSRSTNTMHVLEDLSGIIGGGSAVCYLSRPGGDMEGPIAVSVTQGDRFTVTGGYVGDGLTFDDDLQRPQFIVGLAADFVHDVKITKLSQAGEHLIDIVGVLDNPNAYVGFADPVATQLDAAKKLAPVISKLEYTLDGQADSPYVRLNWESEYSDKYLIDISYDNKTTWLTLEDNWQDSAYSMPLDGTILIGDVLWFRVAGMSLLPGVPAEINILQPSWVVPDVDWVNQVGDFVKQADIEWENPPVGYTSRVTVRWNSTDQRVETFERGITKYSYNWFHSIYDDPGVYLGEINTKDGARDITFAVSYVDEAGTAGPETTVLCQNAQVGALSNVFYWELLKGALRVSYQRPDARDFFAVEIHLSKTQGFTPDMSESSTTRVYAGPLDDITLSGVLDFPDTYYMLVSGGDAWGRDSRTWSTEELISTTDGVTSGSVDWDDLISLPGIGVKMNRSTFTGGYAAGRWYLHGFAAGAAADVDLNVLLGQDYLPVAKHAGYANRDGLSFIGYFTGLVANSPWTVGGSKSKYATVSWYNGVWYYDDNQGDFIELWAPDSFLGEVFCLAQIRVASGAITEVSPYAVGLSPAFVVGSITGAAWVDVFGDDKPEDGAETNVNAFGIKPNYSDLTTPDNDAVYVHSYKNGVASTDDFRVDYKGALITISPARVEVSVASGRMWVAYDTSGGTPFTVNGSASNWAAVGWYLGAWLYDDGSGTINDVWVPGATGFEDIVLLNDMTVAGGLVTASTAFAGALIPDYVEYLLTHADWDGVVSKPPDSNLLNDQQDYGDVIGTKPPADADNTASNGQDYTWISGDKPDPDATVNNFYRQEADPGGVDGDMWYKPSTKILYGHLSGGWVTYSNGFDNTDDLLDGAGLGLNNMTYSDTAPGSPVDGDLWFDTNDPTWPLMVRSGISWELIGTVNKVTYSSTEPTGTVNGELWVDTDNGTTRRYEVSGDYWRVHTTAVRSFSGTSAPTDPPYDLNTGDLFFNTSTKRYYFYNGSSWEATSDNTAANGQDYAWVTGTKPDPNATVNKITYQSSQPTGTIDDELWVDTDTGITRRWRQSTNYWEVAGTAVRSFSGTSQPNPATYDLTPGDFFFNTGTKTYYYWTGSAWTASSDSTAANPQSYSWVTGTKPPTDADKTSSNQQGWSWISGSKPDIDADKTSADKLADDSIINRHLNGDSVNTAQVIEDAVVSTNSKVLTSDKSCSSGSWTRVLDLTNVDIIAGTALLINNNIAIATDYTAAYTLKLRVLYKYSSLGGNVERHFHVEAGLYIPRTYTINMLLDSITATSTGSFQLEVWHNAASSVNVESDGKHTFILSQEFRK